MLVELRGTLGCSLFLIEVLGDVTNLFLDTLNEEHLGGIEALTSMVKKELLKPLSKDTSSDFNLTDGVDNGVTFVNGYGIGNTITRVDNETSASSISVETQDGLWGNVAISHLEVLEHGSDHPFSVFQWVSWSIGKENTLGLGWEHSELVLEGMMPDSFHIFPRLNDTVDNRVIELKGTSLLIGLVTNLL